MVYMMWDFVGRTIGSLGSVQNPRLSNIREEAWSDAVGRSMLANSLIHDTSGKLKAMNGQVGHNDDEGVGFTDEIKQAAKECINIETSMVPPGHQARGL